MKTQNKLINLGYESAHPQSLLFLLCPTANTHWVESFYHPWRVEGLSQHRWLATYQDGLPAHRWSPIAVLSH